MNTFYYNQHNHTAQKWFTDSGSICLNITMVFQELNLSLDSLGILVSILSSIISLILSALLVWLYGQQKTILKRQTELTESSQKALPRVRTYNLFSWLDLHRFEYATGEDLDFPGSPDCFATFSAYISNSGNGFVHDLRAELVIESPSKKYSTIDALAYRTNLDQLAFNGEGGVIAPDENEVLMTSEFVFPRDALEEEIEESNIQVDNTVSPSELLWILYKLGENPVQIGIFIHYKDGTGVREPIQLLTSQADLSEFTDIRMAYEWGGPIDSEVEPMYENS